MASDRNLFKQGILLDTKIIDRIEKGKIGMQKNILPFELAVYIKISVNTLFKIKPFITNINRLCHSLLR